MTRRRPKGERARREAERSVQLAWDVDPERSVQIALHASRGLSPPQREAPDVNVRMSAGVYRRLRLAQINNTGSTASVSAFVDRLLDFYDDMAPIHDPAIGEMLDRVALKLVDISSARPTRLSALHRSLHLIINTDAPLAIARNLPFDALHTAYSERSHHERTRAASNSTASIALKLATGDRTTLKVLEHELSRQARARSKTGKRDGATGRARRPAKKSVTISDNRDDPSDDDFGASSLRIL